MPFSDIKGQDKVIHFLKRSLINGRLHHAYLFIGNRGVGKTLTAKNFAMAINCTERIGAEPCNECISCKKIEKSEAPDVFFMSGQGEGGTFLIDDIKNLRNLIILRPYEAKKKIFILEDVSRMTPEAANAFLKTLEEPPDDSIMMLIGHDKSKILSTIYSRCEVIYFDPLRKDLIKELLLEKLNLDKENAEYITHFSDGSLKAASEFLESEKDILEHKNRLIDKFDASFKPYDEDASALGEDKTEIIKALGIIIYWYRDILMAKVGLPGLVANRDRLSEVVKKSELYTKDELIDILKRFKEAEHSINLNANTKISMSVLKMEIDDICMR